MKKHISLGFTSSGDVRQPRTVRLLVQDEEWRVDLSVELSEHDFVALMAGMNITVDTEIPR